jgi:hypothetical protein
MAINGIAPSRREVYIMKSKVLQDHVSVFVAMGRGTSGTLISALTRRELRKNIRDAFERSRTIGQSHYITNSA